MTIARRKVKVFTVNKVKGFTFKVKVFWPDGDAKSDGPGIVSGHQ
jgi:hypothetical protein